MGKSSKIRYIFLGLTLLFALPLGWGVLSGISTWLSPYITLNSVLALKSFVALNSIGFAVLFAAWFKRNFFCRYLCPVGCILNHVPSPAKFRRRFSVRKVPPFGIWLVIISLAGALFGIPLFIYLDPVSVINTFFSIFLQKNVIAIIFSVAGLSIILILQYFLPGLWCFRICPLGGLQMMVTDIKSLFSGRFEKHQGTDLVRRALIGGVAGAAASIVLPKTLNKREHEVIRPPAALDSEQLYTVCTRCGSCIKACPTKILQQDTRITLGVLTPMAIFTEGYCLETCNNCSVVCPSGAITLFETGAKSRLHMGLAEVETKNCLLTSLKECDRCKAVCPYDAVKILTLGGTDLMLPEISAEKCVGCGACKIVCPVSCISIKV